MAAADRPTPEHLGFLQRVSGEIQRYGVLALLRALEARARDLPRIGHARLPEQNVADLVQVPHLAFPGTTLERVEMSAGRARVEGYWLGLTGPMGPLPLHLTEFATYERRYSKTQPFGRFLDMLAGRMLQFFYRAWADAQPAAHADRDQDDRFAGYLARLSGATEGVAADAAFPARARLHYAGLFASRRSAAGLQDALAHLLCTPVRLREFQTRWREIDGGDRTRLGTAFNGLGTDAVLGGRVRSVSDAFQVVVRAGSIRDYEGFLPTGGRFKIAAEAIDAFAPSHLEWDIELEVDEHDVRPARLDGMARLGWTSWMAPTGGAGVRADARLGRSARRLVRAKGVSHD
jgi:type VI secretion system ImpH/TssG family protein